MKVVGKTNHPTGSESDRGILRKILPPFKTGRNLKLLESNVVVRIHLFFKKSDFECTKNQPLVVRCELLMGFSCDFSLSDIGVEMAQMENPHLFSSQGWKPFSSAVGKTQGAPLNSEEKTLTERVALYGRKATYILTF